MTKINRNINYPEIDEGMVIKFDFINMDNEDNFRLYYVTTPFNGFLPMLRPIIMGLDSYNKTLEDINKELAEIKTTCFLMEVHETYNYYEIYANSRITKEVIKRAIAPKIDFTSISVGTYQKSNRPENKFYEY
jgi:hypothetical protein